MRFTKQQKWIIGVVIIVILIAAYSKTVENYDTESMATSSYAPAPEMGGGEQFAMRTSEKLMAQNIEIADSAVYADNESVSEQRVIKNAEFTLLVESVAETQLALETAAKEFGGFVQDASTYEMNDKTMSGQATLRIDVKNFESALAKIRDLAINIERERVTGQDVTEQFTDLEAQLHNARAEEVAYLNLLQRAGSVADLLEVQRELSNVRGEIEMLEGRLKYLANQTDMATIGIWLSEKPSLIAPTGDFRVVDIIKEAIQALIVTFQTVLSAIVWLVVFSIGVVLPLALITLAVRKLWRRYKR